MKIKQYGSENLYQVSLSNHLVWLSYDQVIAVHNLRDNQLYINVEHYSQTTRHLNIVMFELGAKLLVNKTELDGSSMQKYIKKANL